MQLDANAAPFKGELTSGRQVSARLRCGQLYLTPISVCDQQLGRTSHVRGVNQNVEIAEFAQSHIVVERDRQHRPLIRNRSNRSAGERLQDPRELLHVRQVTDSIVLESVIERCFAQFSGAVRLQVPVQKWEET